jgi:acyl-coenzyme A thioesterase PaaI-like protein
LEPNVTDAAALEVSAIDDMVLDETDADAQLPGIATAVVVEQPPSKKSLFQRIEAFISRLSTRNNFWHKVCSLIWLPYAFRSGITMKRLDAKRFTAVLPFKRINRNWYNAMAGAALLGNSEVAAGMFLFSQIGGEYIVVCKEMKYRFLRPCLGPAVYEIVNTEDLQQRMSGGSEFNIRLEMEIRQQLRKKGRELKVGRCEIVFHCTPKSVLAQRRTRVRP